MHASLLSLRLPNAFALNSTQSIAPADPQPEGSTSPVETDTLEIEEVQAPATGTRKAKVLYDYDAADSSELSLLADEVRFHHQAAVRTRITVLLAREIYDLMCFLLASSAHS